MNTWTDFLSHFPKQHWTPVFNAYLEAMFRNPDVPIRERVNAWILRRSWGNQSEFCCNANRDEITQSDCAREVGSDRRSVSPAFIEAKRLGFIRTIGREIYPVSEPNGTKEENCPDPYDTHETLAKVGFSDYIAVWGEKHPDDFRAYQEVDRQYTEIAEKRAEYRSRMLNDWRAETKLSEGFGQNGQQRPEGNGQVVAEGTDNLSEGYGTNADPILMSENLEQKRMAAAAGSLSLEGTAAASKQPPPPSESHALPQPERDIKVVTGALKPFKKFPERADVIRIVQSVRERDPEATGQEMAEVIREVGKSWKGPRLGLFFDAVPKAFPLDRRETSKAPASGDAGLIAEEPTLEQRIAKLEDWLIHAEENHLARKRMQSDLAELKAEKAKQPKTHAAGAGGE